VAEESMTSEERFMTAVRLEKPDRVPVAPLIDMPAAAHMLGLKAWEVAEQGWDAMLDVILRVWDEFGGWDTLTGPVPHELFFLGGTKAQGPTEGAPENQFIEYEIWTPDEYPKLFELGWGEFSRQCCIPRVWPEATEAKLAETWHRAGALGARTREEAAKRGAFIWTISSMVHPFFWLSLTRSMQKFTEDLFYRPELVEEAMATITPAWIEIAIQACKARNSEIYFFSEERAGGFFYSLEMFERFWWPYTEQIVDALWSEGIVCAFHLDTCWDKNLPYFKKLPRGSAIIDLDGTTDIFAAAELLDDHMCICSDVHPALLSLGTPEEVEAYCKKLIDEIGHNGGLILQAGCSVPYAVTPDNFRAMLDTGKNYELSKA
jgi:uroporphyrinogen-III decarboxylase